MQAQMVPEPRDDDDIALDKDTECDECGCFMCDCVCSEPDVMYADHYDDQKQKQTNNPRLSQVLF